MRPLARWQELAHDLAVEKGFYDGRPDNDPTWDGLRLMKIVAEVAEAYEAIKSGEPDLYYCDPETGCLNGLENFSCNHDGPAKPLGLGIELADIFIFLCDFAQSKGIDLEQMVEIKHSYNQTRSRMHGKKI